MKIEGAIFDLDGTLLDSMYIWDTIGEEFLTSKEKSPEDGLRETLRPLNLVQTAEYFRAEYDMTDPVQRIIDELNGMLEHYYFNVFECKDGVLEALDKLLAKGVKMCVATATDRYLAEAALRRNGIIQYFVDIITCTEVNAGKDSPRIFQKALRILGTEKTRTYVFEDALYAIETAKRAGFPVVAVYDKSANEQQERIKRLSDIRVKSWLEWNEKR